MAAPPAYDEDPDIVTKSQAYFDLNTIEELHDDSGEAHAELELFPGDVRTNWPPWLKWQFKKYIKLLDKLEIMRLEAPTQGKPNTPLVRAVTWVIAELTIRKGIMYHENCRFTLGGPGAHPDDIKFLVRDAGLQYLPQGIEMDTHRQFVWAWIAYQQCLIRMSSTAMASEYAKDWGTWLLLSTTTLAARTRGLIRGYEPSEEDYRENSHVIHIPRKLNDRARVIGTIPGDTPGVSCFVRDKPLNNMLHEFGFAALKGRGPVWKVGSQDGVQKRTIEETKRIVDEGGSFDEESGWASSLELLQKQHESVSFWENGAFRLVPVHPAWTTPGLPQTWGSQALQGIFAEHTWRGPNVASGAIFAQQGVPQG